MRTAPIELYREGLEGATWYDDTRKAFHDRLGESDGDLFLALLAATSPRANLRSNMTKAIRAFDAYKATGSPLYGGTLPAHVGNLWRAVKGEPLQGLKVGAFHAALKGDPNAVAIDVWMLRAFDMPDKASKARIREVQRRIRNLASHLHEEPRRVQAAIWTGYKRRVSPTATVANYETLYDQQRGLPL